MLKTLKYYIWVIVFILMLCPYPSIAGSGTPSAGEIWIEPVTGMEFVWVPGGCYMMGCGNWTSDCFSDEKPVHEVCVDGFWMGKTEVTQGQWKKVMGENPAGFKKSDNYPVERVKYPEVEIALINFVCQLRQNGSMQLEVVENRKRMPEEETLTGWHGTTKTVTVLRTLWPPRNPTGSVCLT